MTSQDRTDELFKVLHHLKKAKNLVPDIPGVPHGEFLMMHRIHCCMKEGTGGTGLPGVRVSELSARMGMSMPAVSQMLKSLQRKGIVTRIAATDDRRVVYVALTEPGEEILSRAIKEFVGKIEQVAGLFGEEKMQEIISLLEDLGRAIDQVHKTTAEKKSIHGKNGDGQG